VLVGISVDAGISLFDGQFLPDILPALEKLEKEYPGSKIMSSTGNAVITCTHRNVAKVRLIF